MSTLQTLNEHYEGLREFNLHARTVVSASYGLIMIAQKLNDVATEKRFMGFLKDFEEAIKKNEIPEYEYELRVRKMALEHPEKVILLSEQRAA